MICFSAIVFRFLSSVKHFDNAFGFCVSAVAVRRRDEKRFYPTALTEMRYAEVRYIFFQSVRLLFKRERR